MVSEVKTTVEQCIDKLSIKAEDTTESWNNPMGQNIQMMKINQILSRMPCNN